MLGFLVITAVLVLFQWKVFDLRNVVPTFRLRRLRLSADYLSLITATAEISSIMPAAGRLCNVMVVLAGKLPSGEEQASPRLFDPLPQMRPRNAIARG